MSKTRVLSALAAVVGLVASSQVLAVVLEEQFNDPFVDWVSGWFYTGTNAQSYYYASGNCDQTDRGNNPTGLWISDDKDCGSLNSVSPVTIYFDPSLGDSASYFSLDAFACYAGGTLNIYDRFGALDASVSLPSNCWTYDTYEFNLSNGISAFEFVSTGTAIEGNTAIDNVVLDTEGRILSDTAVPTLNWWAAALLALLLLSGAVAGLRKRKP